MEKVTYEFINTKSDYYKEAVKLRYDVFYKPSNCSMEIIEDAHEKNSLHLAAISNDKVVGYIRFTPKEKIGVISQFVVDETARGKSNIGKNLFGIIEEKAKEIGVNFLSGEIRLPVAAAAKRFGFTVGEEVFPSSRTGIPHRRVYKSI